MSKSDDPNYVAAPFLIAVDTREQLPYSFANLRTDASQKRRQLQIATRRRSLAAGDYSIIGHECEVAIERKSLQDLCGTFTRGRIRFVRELEKLNSMDSAWVVCEAEMSDLAEESIRWSNVNPKTLWRSVMAWQIRFPRVHWWGCPGRIVAEAVTYRLLEKWWTERIARPTAKNKRKMKQGIIS